MSVGIQRSVRRLGWTQCGGLIVMFAPLKLQEPVIMSAGWESNRGGTVIARHEYKGLSKRPYALEDWVAKETQEQNDTSKFNARRSPRLQRQTRRYHVPGRFATDSEDADGE